MNIVIAFFMVFAALYFGEVIGLYILCDSMSELSIARSYAIYMPLLSLMYVFRILFGKHYVGISKLHALRTYFTLNSNIIIAYACAEVLRERKRSMIVYRKTRRSSFVLFSFKDTILKAIFSNVYVTYR